MLHISKFIEKEALEKVIISFGVFSSLVHFILLFSLDAVSFDSKNTILKILALGFSLMAIFIRDWPVYLKNHSAIFIQTILFYCLSFFPLYNLFCSGEKVDWLINVVLSVVLLIIVVSPIAFFLHFVFGLSFAFFLSFEKFFQGSNTIWNIINRVNFESLFTGLYIFGFLFSVKLLVLEKERKFFVIRQKTLEVISMSIAHELRTPLAIILQKAKTMKSLQGESENLVARASRVIIKSVTNAFLVIEMFLMKFKNIDFKALEKEDVNVEDCLISSLKEYPLSEEEAMLIKLNTKASISFLGNELLLKHVFFNLIKNALHSLKISRKGLIKIWIGKFQHKNCLFFLDTGVGMSKQQLEEVFSNFTKSNEYGNGVGLLFCKMVMQEFGGDIYVQSRKGKYTLFMLIFP